MVTYSSNIFENDNYLGLGVNFGVLGRSAVRLGFRGVLSKSASEVWGCRLLGTPLRVQPWGV